jgi:hypothetical protein
MSTISEIVCGGGWKGTRSERVRVKAWIALLAAIASGGAAAIATEPVWVICAGITAGLSLLASVVLFIRERPRVVEFPSGRAGHDPRNLYGATGSNVPGIGCSIAEPHTAPNGDPAPQCGKSEATEGPPSAS